ncbi:ATP-binding protein [Virgibacillus natechei]
MNNPHHLPHLKDSLPKDVVTYQTSFYTVALEGWRRGLELKYYNNKRGGRVPSISITYSLSDGNNEYHFVCARGSKSKREAILKAENKSSAYKYMKENGVPVPESKTFNFADSSIEDMCDYGERIGYPIVVKPTNMGGGRGVVTHIDSKQILKKALLNIKDELNKKSVIIEKYFEGGVDYRFYVIENRVIAVSKNYSSNVIGDGKSNLEELIDKRNIHISNNMAAKNRIIKIDKEMLNYLNEQNISLDHIPQKGERFFLRKHGTHLGKRLSVDCTNTVDPKFKKYAVDALNSIPGLPTGSIDMIINEEKNEGIVNEINTKGEIMMHVFPVEGEAVDVPKYLIDYYFPNTKKINDNFHFEYKPVKELFLDGYADEITIPMYPKGMQYKKTFVVEGERLGPLYLKKLKRKAANLRLMGHIKSESKKGLEILTIGPEEKINKFEEFINTSGTGKSKIFKVTNTDLGEFDGQSSIGLEIVDEDV